jgi:hypothetical protein
MRSRIGRECVCQPIVARGTKGTGADLRIMARNGPLDIPSQDLSRGGYPGDAPWEIQFRIGIVGLLPFNSLLL